METRVSTSFVRNLRKGHLQEDGTPAPGHEFTAAVLLEVHKAMQQGWYTEAMLYGKAQGIDLEALYTRYLAELAAVKAFGPRSLGLRSSWELIERIMKKYGLRPRGAIA